MSAAADPRVRFLAFVAGLLGVPAEGLSMDTAYGSIPEWDSVMHLRLVMELECEFGAAIPMEEVPRIRTLGDFYRAVAAA